MTAYFIFAPRRYLRRYLKAGWRLVGPVAGHHGSYSVLLTREDAP